MTTNDDGYAMVTLRVSARIKALWWLWSERSSMRPAQFLRMALVRGAMELAKELHVFRETDILE
jgi:hypothetical protein